MRKLNLKLPDIQQNEPSLKVKKANKIFGIINIVLGAMMIFLLLLPVCFMSLSSGVYFTVCQISLFSALVSYILLILTSMALLIFLMTTRQKITKNFGAICIIAIGLFTGVSGLLPFVAIGGGIAMVLQNREKKENKNAK